ncbi:MAG TPA: adenosylcobinamide-GDP ribazoletransferase [Anaeromyxobacteraceae bacterium]|nr:adenosylcobinamide-GDP ribazoletransferase [Anaeromyxobacteraceae bacterium]
MTSSDDGGAPAAERPDLPVLGPMAVAVQFLTRFPVRARLMDGAALGRSVPYFPVAGLLLGAAQAALGAAFAGRLGPPLAAALLLAAHAFLTGGLHLDGLADVVDGLSAGHRDRARTLAIMKDSRIGAHGAAALVLALLVKWAALTPLLARRDLWALLAFPVVARWLAVPLVVFFPYARPEGMGKPFHGGARPWHLGLATILAALAVGGAGGAVLLPSLAAVVAGGLAALAAWRRLGGLTGDVYGACIELAELGFLVAAAAAGGVA